LTFLEVTAQWEKAVQGAIILAAVTMDAARRHRAHASGRRVARA
jgi:ribose/xylose/arabinose/galactoside ABC-type transport system permease subunit